VVPPTTTCSLSKHITEDGLQQVIILLAEVLAFLFTYVLQQRDDSTDSAL
jgi:hypothetical protein